MPRRKISIFAVLVYPIIIALCIVIYCIYAFANWLQHNLGMSSEFAFYFAVVIGTALIVSIPIAIALFNRRQNEQARKIKDEWDKRIREEQERKYRGMQIVNIDLMTGIEFEKYLQRILTHQGYSVYVTQVTGDLGVDLIASKNDEKIAIQAKRHNNKVSRRAISDAVAGMYHYGCNKAMVITNNYFSPGAVALAKSTECRLINRDTLADWINEFQNSHPEIT